MRSYNEIILDASVFATRLPRVVAAVFFPVTADGGEEYARVVRTAFTEAFNLTDGAPPLVRMDLTTDEPFVLVEPRTS